MSVTARVPERAPESFDDVEKAVKHAKKAAQEVANTHNPTAEKKRGDSIVQWAVTDNLTGRVIARGLAHPPGHPSLNQGELPSSAERAP